MGQKSIRSVETSRGKISYELSKKKIKKMYLRVQTEGNITVSAPNFMKVGEIDAFVLKNEEFIFQGLQKVEQRQEEMPSHTYTTGDQFFLMGEKLTLEVREGFRKKTERIGDLLVLQLPFSLDGSHPNISLVEEMVGDFFYDQALPQFYDLMSRYQVKLSSLGIPTAQLKIKQMKSQWGSCNRRNNVIALNFSLIHLPLPLIEYVVLHEFCHFIHGNHSKDFYDLVACYMPDWKERRQALKSWNSVV